MIKIWFFKHLFVFAENLECHQRNITQRLTVFKYNTPFNS